ncbi:MAG: hypothetical protein QM680_07860 [Luteolibacter sp.]
MAKYPSHKSTEIELPEWIFRWRLPNDTLFGKFAALLICTSAFAVFLTMVRVRVVPPMQPEGRKANLIYLNPGPEAAAWALRAQEGGPFPSRLEPAAWPTVKALEEQAMQALNTRRNSHQVELKPLPEYPAPGPILLEDRGETVLPEISPPPVPEAPVTKLVTSPVIYPLANLTAAELPGSLPAFPAEINDVLVSSAWRLLVRLNPDGSVAETVTLTGESNASTVILEKWLQSVRFRPISQKPSLWVGVAIGFINLPASDGSHAH